MKTERNWVWYAGFAAGALIVLILLRLTACSSEPGPAPAPGGGGASCDGLEVGQSIEINCPQGKTVKTCTADGLKVEPDQCGTVQVPPPAKKACADVVTFDEVKPILSTACASCHPGRDTIDGAKPKWDRIVADVQVNSVEHMPPGQQLAPDWVTKLGKWKADGFLKEGECDGATPGGGGQQRPRPVTFREIETAIFADLSTVNINDQVNVRYLLYTDRINAGAAVEELAIYKKAAAKSTASVSVERQIYAPALVAPGILRVDIDELGINATQWTQIENASQLQLESNTSTGKTLKQLTKSRLPWMLVSEFNDVAMRNGNIYYNLTQAPATFQALVQKLKVDFSDDLKKGEAAILAFNGSRLSPAANRLMTRFESEDGVLHVTEDTGPIVNANQSIFVKPGVAGGGTFGNLQFAAGEMIYTLPNGMMGFFLADAAGRRLNQADPNVVHDFSSNPNSPIIINAISCVRCHGPGYLTAKDEVRAKLTAAGSQVDPRDVQLLLALYKPQAQWDAFFAADNAANTAALTKLGLDPSEPDPISQVNDQFRGDLKLADVAGWFGQTAEQFTQTCINVSAAVSGQLSQLTQGGTASHDQLVQVVPLIKRDCLVFEDPIN